MCIEHIMPKALFNPEKDQGYITLFKTLCGIRTKFMAMEQIIMATIEPTSSRLSLPREQPLHALCPSLGFNASLT